MMRVAIFLAGLFGVSVVAAQQTTVFLPSVCSQADGRAGGAWPGFTQRFRMQVLLHGAPLSSLANRALLGLAVRRDGQYLQAHAGGRAALRVAVSHAALDPSSASALFATNRGADARDVFFGEVVLPDAPALAHRDAVSWQAPHAVDLPFNAPFPFVGGPLCIDIDGAPVAAARSPWWRIDYDLFTHDGQSAILGAGCDPLGRATVSTTSLLPGASLRLISAGPVGAMGIAMVDGAAQDPGLDLGFLGATGCRAQVMPSLMFGTTYLPPTIGNYGWASVRLQLPGVTSLLGASLASQWLAYPNPVNPARLTTTNAVTMRVATQQPNLAGVTVRTPVVADPTPLPALGSVLPHLVPVLCLRAQ